MFNDRYYEAFLADGQNYLFDSNKICKVRTVKDTPDEDWKTALAKGISKIPVGTELVIEDFVRNFYGHYFGVRYDGTYYYVDPRNVEYVGME